MDSTIWLFLSLIISIVIIIYLIIKAHLNASIALIVGSVLLGLLVGLPFQAIIGGIDSGFGSMLGDIGLPIGFGIILGKLLSDSGGANRIAEGVVSIFPDSAALYALAFTAFFIAIPVFFDVVFVVLLPVGIALKDRIGKSLSQIVGAISIGAGTGFLLVPPAPPALGASEIMGTNIGNQLMFGIIIGSIAIVISVAIHQRLMETKFWDDSNDIKKEVSFEADSIPNNSPSFFFSILPILTPVVLIITNSISSTIMGANQPEILSFIGSKTFSMLSGVVVAYLISVRPLGGEGLENSANEALKDAGTVLLITGAGGSFAEIIAVSGVSDRIAEVVSGFGGNFIVILIIGWAIGAVLRQVVGSGTVAAVTSAGILAGVASSVSISPIFIVAACLSGSLFGATINDSGFWIVANTSGFSVSGGAKTYSFGEMISSVIALILVIITASISLIF